MTREPGTEPAPGDETDRPASLWRDAVESVSRVPNVDTPRNRVLRISQTVWLHLHPAKVRRHGLRLGFTLGAGGISFFLFLVTLVTGAILMLYYRPTPQHAYLDMKGLDFDVPFGMFNRNLHRWAAHAMVILVWLHMVRVFLTGSYKAPRQFNWVVGVCLLVLTMLLSFTGYLLPWDQLSMWAVTVGTNMAGATPFLGHDGPFGRALGLTAETDIRAALLGGATVGGAALLRFYVLHCIVLPLALSFGLALHFWRIRKDGGISGPCSAARRPKGSVEKGQEGERGGRGPSEARRAPPRRSREWSGEASRGGEKSEDGAGS